MPNKIMTVTIWIILLCMTKQTEQEKADVQSWCSVNETYKGDETTLTCSFDQDVSTSKQIIHLQHKTANGFQDVIVYNWTFGQDLLKRPDYQIQLEGNVTNTLTANMNVSLEHAGYYRCVVGAIAGKECMLIIKDVQSWCSVNETYKGDETTLTCSFDQDVSTSKQRIHLQHKTANGFEDILIYDWAIGQDLLKRPDYQIQLEGNVTNSLAANMNVSLEHAGYYRCVVGASEGKECKLIIKDVQSWCSVNETYKGDETTLTCSFDQDVSTSKQIIHLQHKTTKGFEDIYTFDWAIGREMIKRQDYQVQVEGNVTNSLTTNMKVSLEHAGYYRCVVGASAGKECKLIIKDVQSWCSVNETYKGDETTLTCSFDQDVSTSKKKIHLQHKTSNIFKDILIYDLAIGRDLFKRQDYQVQVEDNVSNSLTANMNVSLWHAGDYRCVVGAFEGKECKLIIKVLKRGLSPFNQTMLFIGFLYISPVLVFLVIQGRKRIRSH